MSVASFDSIRDTNTRLIRKALAGVVFVKRYEPEDDPITQIYTTAAGLIIPPGYIDVGAISKSAAVRFARETSNSDVESWGFGEPTRRDIVRDVTTMQFTMQESKKQVFELYNSVDLSQVTADEDGNVIVDKPSRPQRLDWRAFTLSKDGDGPDSIYFLKWLPNAQVTSIEDQSWSEDSEVSYTVTMTGYEDPALKTAVREVWGGPGLDAAAMGFSA